MRGALVLSKRFRADESGVRVEQNVLDLVEFLNLIPGSILPTLIRDLHLRRNAHYIHELPWP